MLNFNNPISPSSKVGGVVCNHVFVDDFSTVSASTTGDLATWLVTDQAGGSFAAAIAEPNGAVTLTVAGTANDSQVFNLNGLPFRWSDGHDFVFEAKLKLSTTAETWFVGLGTSGMDIEDDIVVTPAENHAGFMATDASIDATAYNGTSSTADTGSDITADTYVVLTMKWSALAGKLFFSVDGDVKHTMTRADDNLPVDGTFLTPAFGVEASSPAACDMDVDFVVMIADRQ